MVTVDSLRPADIVIFARDCAATQIPYGNIITVPKGTEAQVGQTLGGNVTLQIAAFGLVQVMHKDISALSKDGAMIIAAGGAGATPATEQGPADEKQVWEELKACYDPEIPVNIVDLGLVYDVKLTPLPSGNSHVDVKMTLTAMGCGMGPVIAEQARDRLLTVPGVAEADVQIVWDPPWNQGMMTEAAKLQLGLL